MNETEAETTFATAVSAKYNGVEASAGIGSGNASNSKVTAQRLNQLTSFRAKGGDATLVTNPQRWPDSMKDHNKWAVISVAPDHRLARAGS